MLFLKIIPVCDLHYGLLKRGETRFSLTYIQENNKWTCHCQRYHKVGKVTAS